MNKSLKPALIFIMLIIFLNACSSTKSIIVLPDDISLPERGFIMGVLPLPSKGQTFEEAYKSASECCEFVPAWGRPTPFFEMAAELSGNWGDTFVKDYTRGNGLIPVLNLSFMDKGMNLMLPDGMETGSLSDKKWRNEYKKAAIDAVIAVRPAYISLGNEVNRWYEKYGTDDNSPNGFQHYISLYEEIYDSIRKISPQTKIYCTFAREIVSENREADLGIIKSFNPDKIDMLVLTSYPFAVKGINKPGDIPEDYYLKAYELLPGKPFGFSEIAWPSSPEFGGEYGQADFIYLASTPLTRNRGVKLVMFGWPWLNDMDENDTAGLIKTDGTPKASFEVWQNLYNSTGINGIRLRVASIPKDKIKRTPEKDIFPPILNSKDWYEPVPLDAPVNSAGAEDSPFITPDGKELYFFFTPDVDVPVEKQILDGVTGVWTSKNGDGIWTEPERLVLGDRLSMDGCVYVNNDIMWFASVREGNYGEIDLYTAKRVEGKWSDIQNAGEQLNKEYELGEFHFTQDFRELYCGGPQKWEDFAGKDIFVLQKTDNGYSEPQAIPGHVNTNKYNEDQPFITLDGNELWFTGQSRKGLPGPSVFRSLKASDGTWGEPEEILSSFAGEPTLDSKGNIYFIHHYFTKDMKMLEADIYVAYKR